MSLGLTLVTGGSGMLGARIARLLVARGEKVRVTYLPGDTLAALEDLRPLEHAPADLLDEDAMGRALEGVETVVHTAALVSFDPALYEQQMLVNVEGTRRLLAAARRAGVRRLVHTSTVNTLGIPPPGTLGDEGTPFNWGPYRIGYMDSKRAAEELVLEEARRGLHAVVVLPGTLFGPGDVHLNGASYIRLVARAPLVAPAPPGGTTVAHVDDVAGGHLLALEHGSSGRRYILGGEPMSYVEMFEQIAAALGRQVRVRRLPAWLTERAGRAGSWLRGRGVPAPLTEGMAAAGAAELYYSSERARRELGWSWRSGRDAIRDGVRWFRRWRPG